MNNGDTLRSIVLTKQEGFLVNTFVFFTFWSLFTGFPIAFNGFFRTVFSGKLGLLLIFVQFIIYMYYISNCPKCFSKSNIKYTLIYILSLLYVCLLVYLSVSEIAVDILTPLFSTPFFILLRDDLKIRCLDRFIKIFSVILAFALLEYFIYLVFHRGFIVYSGLGRVGFEYVNVFSVYDQYLLNIYYMGQEFPRFQCLCEEPGCIGTICGFLIYALKGRKEYKFQYFIFIIAGVFAFSLAFFALFALHFLLNINIKSSFLSLLLLLLLYLVATYVFLELFQDLFYYRLQDGFSGADNRVTGDFNLVFSNAWQRGEMWLPHGSGLGSFGAGAKMWIWRYGIVSFIIVFLSYGFCYWVKAKVYGTSKIACMLFFVAFWISFYQRHWITNLDYIIVYMTIPILFAFQDKKYSNKITNENI